MKTFGYIATFDSLTYTDYDNLDLKEEVKKISHAYEANIVLKQTDKKCLVILGALFTRGVNINILNEKELSLESTTKSFQIMSYVWSKISDPNFPNSDFSNVVSDLDKKIENIKRLGVKVAPIVSDKENKKIFLICPVRNASPEQKQWIEEFVRRKNSEGYKIHAPHLHTVQTDLLMGYTICLQNAKAIASSSEVDIYYDKSSTGSAFDLGVALSLRKPLVLLNKDIALDENDPIDNLVKYWPSNIETYINNKRR